MSDWTSGFQAFQQGMGMLAESKERKRRQQLEEQRMGYEKDRLDIERERAARDAARHNLDLELLGIKKGAINKSLQPPQVPAGMRAKTGTRNEFGGTDFTFERSPDEPIVKDIGGKRFLYNPNTGAAEELKTNYLETFFGKPTEAGGGLPPVGGPLQQVSAPSAPSAGPATSAPAWRLEAIGPNGPTIAPVYPVTEPEIVTRPLPAGGEGQFIRTIDPKSNEVKLSPYNQPESATKISDKTVTLQNLKAARRYAQELKDAIDRSGTWESRFGNAQDAALLEQNPYLLAISMAKVLDPGSVAREGEVNATKKFMVPLGMTADDTVAKNAIDRLVNDLNTRAVDLGLEAPTTAPGEAPAPAGPPTVNSQAEYSALPSGALYVDGSGKTKRKP